jgi:hypothetical protein
MNPKHNHIGPMILMPKQKFLGELTIDSLLNPQHIIWWCHDHDMSNVIFEPSPP